MSARKIKDSAQAMSFCNILKRAFQLEAAGYPYTAKYKLRYFRGVLKSLRRSGVHEKTGVTA